MYYFAHIEAYYWAKVNELRGNVSINAALNSKKRRDMHNQLVDIYAAQQALYMMIQA